MATLREHLRMPNAVLNYLDGIRADYINGWALVRASNTTPALVLRFEADNPEALAILMQSFKTAVLAIEPRLQLPF
jgi:phosphomannomutase / phosphoglucomutase